MNMLTWTRGKATVTYRIGGGPQTVDHTTYTTTLSSGDRFTITSVEGSFFLDVNGNRSSRHYMTLRDAKAAVQRYEQAQTR